MNKRFKVIRGGSFATNPSLIFSWDPPRIRLQSKGFRIVMKSKMK